jgi:hypothetical protein
MAPKTRADLKVNPATSTTFADTQTLPAEQFIHIADTMEISAGGADVSAVRLRAWAAAESLRASSITRNTNGVVTAATVTWPDGSAGTLTTTHGYPLGSITPDTSSSGWVATQITTITHTSSSQTVTITVTRNANAEATAVTITVA